MRRRQTFAQNNRAPVPSGAGMGAAAASVPPAPSPVSREQEEAAAPIWKVTKAYSDGPVHTRVVNGRIQVFFGDPPPEPAAPEPVPTPATDPLGNARRKPGWPKGKKRGPRK